MSDRAATRKPNQREIAAARGKISLAQILEGIRVYGSFSSSAELADVLYDVYAAMRAQQIIEEEALSPIAA